MRKEFNPRSIMSFVYNYIMKSSSTQFCRVEGDGPSNVLEYEYENFRSLNDAVFTFFRVNLIAVYCYANVTSGERTIKAIIRDDYSDPFSNIEYTCTKTSSGYYTLGFSHVDYL